MQTAASPKIPTRLLVLDTIGVILAGIGVAGLLTDLSGVIPPFRDKTVAGMVAGVGFALVTFALGNIFRWVNRVRSQAPPPPE